MKKILTFAIALVGAASISIAGPYGYSSKSSKYSEPLPMPDEPQGCEACFSAGSSSIDIFGGMAMTDNDNLEDEALAGIGYNYFFTKYLGIGLEYMAVFFESEVHHFGANLIARLPISCVAPYIFAGPGGHVNSVNEVIGQAGAGIEFVLPGTDCTGLFVDGRYVYGDETEDITIIRAGLRKSF